MKISIHRDSSAMGAAAAAEGADVIRRALAARERVSIIVATGASQFETLKALVKAPGIDWSRVTAFHLDEYVGLPESHGASFRKYLRERFVELLPARPEFIPVNGDARDLRAELDRLSGLISRTTIEVCFAGIGENSHLAFNDPPADFETTRPYLVVDLDEACRRQQFGEGWFPTMNDVPKQAISMSIREIMRAKKIILSVPDQRKAAAVKATVEGPVTPHCPASVVRGHADCTLHLDVTSASTLARPPAQG
ncbi:MAG: glucosamine-6-phosphate deaminase [Opitutales bacterium]